jgi:hypothetical protein
MMIQDLFEILEIKPNQNKTIFTFLNMTKLVFDLVTCHLAVSYPYMIHVTSKVIFNMHRHPSCQNITFPECSKITNLHYSFIKTHNAHIYGILFTNFGILLVL